MANQEQDRSPKWWQALSTQDSGPPRAFEQVSDFLSGIDLAQLAKEWSTSPTGLSGTHAFKPLMTLLYGESEEPRTHDPETGIPYAAAMENPFSRPGGSRQPFIEAAPFHTDEEHAGPMGGMPASGPKGVAKGAKAAASLIKRAEALAKRQWKAMTGKGTPVKTPTPTVTSTGKPVKRVTTQADAASAQAKKDARNLERKRVRQEARLKKLEGTPSYYDDTGGVIDGETLQRRFGSGPYTSGHYQGIVYRVGDSFKVYDPEVAGKVAGIYPSKTAAIRALKELRYQAGIVRGRNVDAYADERSPGPGRSDNSWKRVSVPGLDLPDTHAVEQSRYLRGYEPGGEYYIARQEEGYVRPPPDRTKDDVRTFETLRTKRADAKKEEGLRFKNAHDKTHYEKTIKDLKQKRADVEKDMLPSDDYPFEAPGGGGHMFTVERDSLFRSEPQVELASYTTEIVHTVLMKQKLGKPVSPNEEHYLQMLEHGQITKVDDLNPPKVRHIDDFYGSGRSEPQIEAKKEEALVPKLPKPKVIGNQPSDKEFNKLSPAEQHIFKMAVKKDYPFANLELDMIWQSPYWDDQEKLEVWGVGMEAVERASLRPNLDAATPNPYLESLEKLEAKQKALDSRRKALWDAAKAVGDRHPPVRQMEILDEEEKELKKEFSRWSDRLGRK